MKKLQGSIYIVLILLANCTTNEIMIDKLMVQNNLYKADVGLSKTFTGVAIKKFDSGQTSYTANFRNGVPDGIWKAFGYNGEVIQSGRFTPYPNKCEIKSLGHILRFNICTTNEGNEHMIEVFLVTNDHKESDYGRESTIYKKVLEKIKISDIKVDYALVDKVRIVKAEL